MKIPVSRLWHKKGKLEYYTMLQLQKYMPDIEFEYHVILDQPDFHDEWSEKIDNLPVKATWYTKEDMHNYLKSNNYGNDELINSIPNFIHFYHILINHYLRKTFNYDYTLTIEYDVIFNSYDLEQLKHCLIHKLPFGIIEPANAYCDKALAEKLSQVYRTNIVKYPQLGINAGFNGLNLAVFDSVIDVNSFNIFLSLFDFSGIYKEDGTEKVDWERTTIDTQEQSFHSLMNAAVSENYQILDPQNYYVFPYWVDLDYLLKSKVIHFIGHTKPEIMMEMIDNKLKEWEVI